MITRLKTRLDKSKTSLTELYLTVLLTVGLPFVAYLYFDFRAAIATFVAIQTAVCVLAMRAS